jgi:carbonic anhydrase
VKPTSTDAIFVSPHAWNDQRPDTLVVCCSDGRYRPHIAEYIGQWSEADTTDIYALPGGAAAFDFLGASVMEAHALEAGFRFLVERHLIKNVYLIAHQNCGYYQVPRGFNTHLSNYERQLEDLRRACGRIRSWYAHVGVFALYAAVENGRVSFIPIK